MPHNMAGFCHVCGAAVTYGQPRSWVGERMCCAPDGSPCHQLGQRSAGWRLSEAEAAGAGGGGRVLGSLSAASTRRSIRAADRSTSPQREHTRRPDRHTKSWES